jgi:hypothetical protein
MEMGFSALGTVCGERDWVWSEFERDAVQAGWRCRRKLNMAEANCFGATDECWIISWRFGEAGETMWNLMMESWSRRGKVDRARQFDKFTVGLRLACGR